MWFVTIFWKDILLFLSKTKGGGRIQPPPLQLPVEASRGIVASSVYGYKDNVKAVSHEHLNKCNLVDIRIRKKKA